MPCATALHPHLLFLIFCIPSTFYFFFFFFNDTATTEIYTLSLHDALPIYRIFIGRQDRVMVVDADNGTLLGEVTGIKGDRKSTRLNSSHANISYAVFCLKKKKKNNQTTMRSNRIDRI